MATTRFLVNSEPREVDVSPETPLLWVLRDTIGLTGTKYGCGMALCGACTVHVDGNAVRSCSTPISTVAGKKLTPNEGLKQESKNSHHATWVDGKDPQCGDFPSRPIKG